MDNKTRSAEEFFPGIHDMFARVVCDNLSDDCSGPVGRAGVSLRDMGGLRWYVAVEQEDGKMVLLENPKCLVIVAEAKSEVEQLQRVLAWAGSQLRRIIQSVERRYRETRNSN